MCARVCVRACVLCLRGHVVYGAMELRLTYTTGGSTLADGIYLFTET